jgi:hypothetical protein
MHVTHSSDESEDTPRSSPPTCPWSQGVPENCIAATRTRPLTQLEVEVIPQHNARDVVTTQAENLKGVDHLVSWAVLKRHRVDSIIGLGFGRSRPNS